MVNSATRVVVSDGEDLILRPKTVSVTQIPAILLTTCASSSPAFLMIYSEYNLNKQGDYIEP